MRRIPSATVRSLVLSGALLLIAAIPLRGTSAQSRESAMERIEKAIGAGEATALAATMSQRVSVAVFGASREYSQSQAEHVLRKFFAEYPPSGFSVLKHSETEQGAFVAGRYRSARLEGEIDLYLRLRDRDGNWELREIIIQTEPR
jgi:hypothetical protein